MINTTVLPVPKNTLGESPLWNGDEGALYWLDVSAPLVYRRNADGSVQSWRAPDRCGGLVMREGGGCIAVSESGVFEIDADFVNSRQIATSPYTGGLVQLHEACCDPVGRLWFSVHAEHDGEGEAIDMPLYRYEDGELIKYDVGITGSVSNGMAWSKDGKTMYFTETIAHTVYAFDYDVDTAAISNKRVFAQFTDEDGYPDGATVDAEDGYWLALVGSNRVLRLRPDGTRDRWVEIGSHRPTAPCFAGPNLDRMYVTTLGSFPMADKLLPSSPDDGAIFEVDPGVTGLPEPRFRG